MVFTQFGLAASCVRSSVTLSNMHEQEPRHEVVRAAILEVVENQIRDDKPPETRQTIERLQSEGCSPGEARRLVSLAVSVEIFQIMKHQAEFDRVRYVWNLHHLPQEPWDADGTLLYQG